MAKTAKTKYKRVPIEKYEAMQQLASTVDEHMKAERERREKWDAAEKRIIAKRKAPVNRDKVNGYLYDVATMMNSLRQMCIAEQDPDATIVQAIAEKAGWLTDRAVGELDGVQTCGSFRDWAHYPSAAGA